MSFGAAYAATRQRIVDLVTEMPPHSDEKMVPACPAWTVRELIAHLAAVAVDVSKGNLEGVGSDQWTQRQLDDRIDHTLEELLEEWTGVSAQIDGALDHFPKWAAALFVGDTVTHEHDLRGALGQAGARDTDAVEMSVTTYARWFSRKVKDSNLPAILVKWTGGEWAAGNGEPSLTVAAPTFEILRGLTGRRTVDEVKSFAWSGDPDPYIDLFTPYRMPGRSLGE